MIRSSLVVAALVGWSSVAGAQPAAEPVAPAVIAPVPPPIVEEKPKLPRISITWAPILVVVPLIELTAEYRVADKLGVSITLGAGKRSLDDRPGENIASGPEIEAGLQVRYYAIGNFRHGMEVGLQALEEYVRFDDLPPGVSAAAGGFTVGPFLGYKIATRVGFTFEAQLGARYLVIEPGVQGETGGPTPDFDKWLPLLHLNIGWSF